MSKSDWQIGIQPYRSYGTLDSLRYSCRILRDPGLGEATIHDSLWKNLRASFHRYESDEVPDASVHVAHSDNAADCTSDEEGYCHGNLSLSEKLTSTGWQSLNFEIEQLPYGKKIADHFAGQCLVPSDRAKFGIVSDIDDTVLHTQVGSRLKMLIWSFFRNSYSRLPLPGVARLYRRLAEVDNETDINPTFYVSSSPWNLYPVLERFIDSVDLPKGPILLRDMGIRGITKLASDHSHKGVNIVEILKTYPRLNFILLGDSGQKDAKIYSDVAKQFPGRILCAYIRDTGNVDRAMLDEAILTTKKAGSEMLLVKDSEAIDEHARGKGWIQSP